MCDGKKSPSSLLVVVHTAEDVAAPTLEPHQHHIPHAHRAPAAPPLPSVVAAVAASWSTGATADEKDGVVAAAVATTDDTT
jgi:hypothetical protein